DPEDPAAYSEARTVADMAALLGHYGIERAVIGGLSLGGYMSLGFHLTHPQMVRALMLFATGPGFRNGEARQAWNARAQHRAGDNSVAGLTPYLHHQLSIFAHRSDSDVNLPQIRLLVASSPSGRAAMNTRRILYPPSLFDAVIDGLNILPIWLFHDHEIGR